MPSRREDSTRKKQLSIPQYVKLANMLRDMKAEIEMSRLRQAAVAATCTQALGFSVSDRQVATAGACCEIKWKSAGIEGGQGTLRGRVTKIEAAVRMIAESLCIEIDLKKPPAEAPR